MKTNFLVMKSTLILLIIIFCVFKAQAQQPTITLDFPAVGDSNISRSPDIRLHVNYPWKIDSSCLNYDGFYFDNNWDSTNNRLLISDIYLFQSSIYDNTDSSLQEAISQTSLAKCTFVNDTVFKLVNTTPLINYTQYGVFFDDLRIYNSITSDTITFDTIINPYFKMKLLNP